MGVYAWLRSAVIDGDLLFFNEWAGFGMIDGGVTRFKEVTPLGTLANHWWIGTALLSAPAYLTMHFGKILCSIQTGDGFFGAWGALLAWLSVAFTALATVIAGRLIRQLAPETGSAARATILAAILLGTPLFWYTFRLPLGTHAAGTFAVALLTMALCWHDQDDVAAIAIGLALGLAIATRLQHFVLVPAVAWHAWRHHRSLRRLLLLAGGAALPLASQGMAWWIVYGSPLGPLTTGGNEHGATWLPFHSNALLPVLFSSYHGLFVWAPIALLAAAGWTIGWRRHNDAAPLMILMFAGEWIANGLFDRWFWGGMSFGPRRFVDLAVPMAIGLAWLATSIRRTAFYAMTGIATAWSIALMVATHASTLSLSRYVTFADLVNSVLSALTWSRAAQAPLRSPIADGLLAGQSIAALGAIAAGGLLLLWLAQERRRIAIAACIYFALCAGATATLWQPTRSRAQEEHARYRIDDRVAAHWGPLVDQRTLLGDELAYLRGTGQPDRAAATAREIEEMDARIRALTR